MTYTSDVRILMGMVRLYDPQSLQFHNINYTAVYGRHQNYNISVRLCLFLSQNNAFPRPVCTMHAVRQPSIRERNSRARDVRGVWGEDGMFQDSSERRLLVRNRQAGRIKEEENKSYMMPIPFRARHFLICPHLINFVTGWKCWKFKV